MRTFLHVGCGRKAKNQTTNGFNTENWKEVRLDIDKEVSPDIVGDITNLDMIPAGTYDAVYSSHNIEHLYQHQVNHALEEFKRVLKPSGFLVITCPDLLQTAKLIAEDKLTKPAYTSPAGPITPLDILYGHIKSIEKGRHYMAHKTGFTEKSIRDELNRAGFSRFATSSRPSALDLWAVASKENLTDDKLKDLFQEYCFS